MKHRIVHTLQKYVLNPPIKIALAVGLPLPGYALLETKGRKTGKPRRTPVGDGRIGSQFWLVAEHGLKAGYVRNIERDPRVRLKLREGFRTRWHTGTAPCSPTTTLVSANAGWRISCQAVPGTRGRYASSVRNFSQFGLIWMADARVEWVEGHIPSWLAATSRRG
jgi:deazaflavin-dependent oxidoreductase (nitroreductase family)